jgi:hypothetical protein
VPIFGIRFLEGKCFEELAILSGEMEASLQIGSPKKEKKEAKEEKYTAIFVKKFGPFSSAV